MLNKAQLITDLTNTFSDLSAANMSASAKANAIANAIDNYVKSATVTVNSGIPVSTTGTAAAQAGSTTANGSGSLS